MFENAKPPIGRAVTATAFMFGAVFAFMEIIAASHQQYWVAVTPSQWAETALAWLAYSAAIAAVTAVVLALLRVVPPARPTLDALVVPVAGLAALGLWFEIRRDLPDSESIWWTAAPIGFVVTVFMIRAMERSRTRVITALSLATASAAATFSLTAQGGAFESGAVQTATRHALTSFALMACASFILGAIVSAPGFKAHTFFILIAVLAGAYPATQLTQAALERSARSQVPPNVLIITIDTLRADALSGYGGVVNTPAFDALAAEGALFERCYSLSPWTIPSIDGMFASRFPPSLTPHASPDERQQQGLSYAALTEYWLDADNRMFIDRISDQYETVAINGNPTLDSQRWLLDRFDHYLLVDALDDQQPAHLRNVPILRTALAHLVPALNDTRYVDTTSRITDYADAYLSAPRRKPFFLWIHYMDPHGPYNPPNRFRQTAAPWAYFPPKKSFVARMADQMSAADKAAARGLYNAEIAYVDACVGSVIAEVRECGLDASTIVALTADHGESFWDHKGWGHAYDLYDEQTRVPLVFTGPGIATTRLPDPVSTIDVLPTLAALMGYEPRPAWRGRSLASAMSTNASPPVSLPCFAQATSFAPYNPEPRQMIVDGEWKLIEGLESGELRLFNVKADPQERHNLVDSHPNELANLSLQLAEWRESFPVSFAEFPSFQADDADEEFVQRMRALGYIAE